MTNKYYQKPDKYQYVSRKIFDRNIDRLEKRHERRSQDIRELRKKLQIVEEVLKILYIKAGLPNYEEKFTILKE